MEKLENVEREDSRNLVWAGKCGQFSNLKTSGRNQQKLRANLIEFISKSKIPTHSFFFKKTKFGVEEPNALHNSKMQGESDYLKTSGRNHQNWKHNLIEFLSKSQIPTHNLKKKKKIGKIGIPGPNALQDSKNARRKRKKRGKKQFGHQIWKFKKKSGI